MKKWEYKWAMLTHNNDENTFINQLNNLGNEGWELIDRKFISGISHSQCYFKREKNKFALRIKLY